MVIRPRSPNYPGIDLRAAVGRAQELYPKVQRGEFTPLDAAEAWGYSGATSPVRRTMAALRQYGLMEAKKGDNARLTTRALTLVLREPESREFRTALREAVEFPSLFEELINSERANGAAGALRQYLVVEKRFTKDGADTFIEVLKASLAFAMVSDDDNMTGLNDGVIDKVEESTMVGTAPATATPASTPPGSIAIPIPLSDGGLGTVTLPVGMTQADWKRLETILDAYRPFSEERIPPSVSPTSERSDDESGAE